MTSNATARDFFSTLQTLHVFIQTCAKRRAIYTDQQTRSNCTKPFQVRALKRLCGTRWGCRADAIYTFNMTIDAVIVTLQYTGETAAKANIAAEAKDILGFNACMHYRRAELCLR